MVCEELLKVLIYFGILNIFQFNVVFFLYNLSRLIDIFFLYLEVVQSYLEEIVRVLWLYSKFFVLNLWVSEVFCDVQCDIFKVCGKFFEEKCFVNIERIFQMISNKLIFGEILKYFRFRLFEIQELRLFGWKVLEVIKNYYKGVYLKVYLDFILIMYNLKLLQLQLGIFKQGVY